MFLASLLLSAEAKLPFHVRVSQKKHRGHPESDEVVLDLTAQRLEERFLRPYREGRPLVVRGLTISVDELLRLRINFTDESSEELRPTVIEERKASGVIRWISDNWYVAAHGKDVTDDYITAPPGHAVAPEPATREEQNPMSAPRDTTHPRFFIVHGRDSATMLEVKNYLQNTLGLPEPVVLHERPSRGRTIIEKFEDHASEADGAIVLLTPDDRWIESGTDDELRRARQNVVFELGFFYGQFGRRSGRVLVLHKGKIDLPSDIHGVVYIDITGGVAAAGEQIRQEVFGRTA